MTVRNLNLVVPLASKATAKRIRETADHDQAASRAITPLIGSDLRRGDVDSTNTSTAILTTLSRRTLRTANRTTTTRITAFAPVSSADLSERRHADFLFEDLVQAYLDCRRNKRNKRTSLEFESNQERNLRALFIALKDRTYTPGQSICFINMRPKPREVWAAGFPDRVVHHLLFNQIQQRFHDSFIADSCACIKGRGTLYAGKRLESKVRSITQNWSKPAYYLKCDLANFFVAIDKNILWNLMAPKITESHLQWLAQLVLFHDPRSDYVMQSPAYKVRMVPDHKQLINHPSDHGLPIGNLHSQFCANIYMNVLDQFIKHQIGARYYIRYVDDFVLLHHDPKWLNNALQQINIFLQEKLHARLNPKKTILQPVDRGIDFVGHVIKPWRRSTRKRTLHEAISRTLKAPIEDLPATANSYFGLLRQASHSYHNRTRLANALRKRGKCIDYHLTKTYQ